MRFVAGFLMAIGAAVVAAGGILAIDYWLGIFTEEWRSPLHLRYLVYASAVAGVAGMALGVVVYEITTGWAQAKWYRPLVSAVFAALISFPVGSILAYFIFSPMWPPESVFGSDPDALAGCGGLAAAVAGFVFGAATACFQSFNTVPVRSIGEAQ